ncbi:MAG: CHAP domain-containing protein [Novosphingobium sp.]|jgi:surface antigen|nr:CHAP domain-containing protein [Brevundimonas sp.]MCZ8323014.1 CHAP domain-containing protein [Novosphingobium sp.]
MKIARLLLPAAMIMGAIATPAVARVIDIDDRDAGGALSADLPPYLQCVPYARQLTGIQIYGDAHTWWGQAEGRYARGFKPKVGAVMAFRPHGNSRLGHVAAVSKIIDSRTVLIRHANWSPINGRRGQIEDHVRAIDVSPDNDWSAVRVWYGPSQALGNTHWPLAGFIYPSRPKKNERLGERPTLARAEAKVDQPRSRGTPSRDDDPIAAIIKRELAI